MFDTMEEIIEVGGCLREFVDEHPDVFEPVGQDIKASAMIVYKWIMNDLMALFNEFKIDANSSFVAPCQLSALIKIEQHGYLNHGSAKKVLRETFLTVMNNPLLNECSIIPLMVAIKMGLIDVGNDSGLDNIIDKVILDNDKVVQEIVGGKEKVIGSLIGKVMKELDGKADAKKVGEMLREKILGGGSI